ncbi:MAG: hypothetical protein BWY87_01215 [Deltaproteobacteria bacterium ADurb.Bin510]|nr:MAG: hypothetical protein BWY87_01215 [Deltaproteobacteria bacterium ADurb.Bin510]
MGALEVGQQQGPFADRIDLARQATGIAVDLAQGAAGEAHPALGAGHAQAVQDVIAGFSAVERPHVVTHHDTIRKLAQVVGSQHLAQFRLTDQQDLQQLLVLGFKIREHPNLFEHGRIEVLALVDDQHGVFAAAVDFQQKVEEFVHQPLLGSSGGRESEFAVDALEQFDVRKGRMQDQGRVHPAVERFEQLAADRGLTGANLASDHHEAHALFDAVTQVREGLLVHVGEEQEFGVGRQPEGVLAETEKAFEHL